MARIISITGLLLLALSHLLLSFGYTFLMSQKPIDFAHWSMLLGATLLFSLWFCLPGNLTKKVGLSLMTLGIAGIVGMCMIDFLLWAMNDDQEIKEKLFHYINSSPSIKIPFLILGPTLFYSGISIATYGLFTEFRWQVLCLNIGAAMIGVGHMIFQNGLVAVIGAGLLLIGLTSILMRQDRAV